MNCLHCSLTIERIKFTCIPGSHPLGNLLGTPLLEAKAREMREELLKTVAALSEDNSKWTMQQDEELVAMVQSLCSRIGVQPGRDRLTVNSIMRSFG